LPDAADATADELRATWGPFIAEAGTYELAEGNLLTVRRLASKNSAVMKSGALLTFSYKLEGNTLWTTQKTTDDGPVTNQVTTKYTRVESHPPSQASIQGVWQLVEVTTTGSNGSTNVSPQPGLRIFTDKHFSRVLVDGDQARPDLPDAATATADELRAVWGPLVGEAGSYELTGGNLFTSRALVAKTPAGMKSDGFSTVSYKLEGNMLWLTQLSTQDGPTTDPIVSKYTRVE
jgi:hypothetical protein